MANILSMTAKKRPQKGPKRDKNGPSSLKNKLFSKFSVSFASLKKCFFTLISQLKLMIFYGTLRKSWSEDIQMSKECLNLGQKSSSCKNKLFSKFSVGFVSHQKCFFTTISKLKLFIFFGTLRKSWPNYIQMSNE